MEELLFYILAAILESVLVPVLGFPGALIRWIVFRKKTLQEYWQRHKEKDASIVFLLCFAVFIGIVTFQIYIHSYYHHPVQTFAA
jgi:hypothetical protein